MQCSGWAASSWVVPMPCADGSCACSEYAQSSSWQSAPCVADDSPPSAVSETSVAAATTRAHARNHCSIAIHTTDRAKGCQGRPRSAGISITWARMVPSRRAFLRSAAASALAWPFVAHAQNTGSGTPRLFQHGVASGDPLGDRVVLWTRVTAPPTRSAIGPVTVRWQVADDEKLTKVVARGEAAAAPERDFTVKVDAAGLRPGRTYFYAFEAGGQRSPVGRTKTLAVTGVERLRLGVVSCSNYAGG